MKTTREILIARHRAAQPKLDQIRRKVVRETCHEKSSWALRIRGWSQELFRLPRPALAILGTVWILILALNLSTSEAPRTAVIMAQKPGKPSPETLQALQEQRKLFAEMVGSSIISDTDLRRYVPRPRSERSTSIAFA